MKAKFVKLTSKKGKEFEALEIQLGVYKGLLFPNPAETAYLKSLVSDGVSDVESEQDTTEDVR